MVYFVKPTLLHVIDCTYLMRLHLSYPLAVLLTWISDRCKSFWQMLISSRWAIVQSCNSKGQFTHTMPFPCLAHAVPLPCRATKGLDCVFPIWFTQCGHVWFTRAVPVSFHDHAVLKATSQGHGTARHGHGMMCELALAIQRWRVGDLPAFGFFWLPRVVPWRLLSQAYQSVKL
jgi:hypothetical protein